ncbi:MAG: YcaQ family DNA glycosylase [Anaerolineae bacterium]|nr:YcaQ family DNA glycosylase [Anaerolineae bacterium]
MHISRAHARRLALYCQGLDGQWDLPADKEGVAQAIERLGYVQIDTIAVVQRAHHHTLWVRCADYAPHMLHALQAVDRRVFEWWASAMSVLPMSHYRFYLPSMRAAARRPRTRAWVDAHRELVDQVMGRIRDEGPLGSRDFQAPEGFVRGGWWDWKPAKRALEVLFDCGELMVAERRNFQRIYDLRERVLPPDVDTREPTADEVARFRVRRALGAYGFAPIDGIRLRQWGSADVEEGTVRAMAEEGEVVLFQIDGMDGTTYCALASVLAQVGDGAPPERQLHILSPFDSLVIRRRWLAAMFGFEYKLEAYTPAAQRQYGYFCLPLLWGASFVGRMDAKADRRSRCLLARKLHLEPGVTDEAPLAAALAPRMWAFARFCGCEDVVVEATAPASFAGPLRRALSAAGRSHPGAAARSA